MWIDVLTLFPEMFQGPLNQSLLKKAQAKGLFTLSITNLRDFSTDKHKTADDAPYGGGGGMVMKIDVVAEALSFLKKKVGHRASSVERRIVLMSPQGEKLNHKKVISLSKLKYLTVLCGHYEGIDDRAKNLVDEEISIGDYVLTGGEIPAMVLIDSVVRQLPGVVKEKDSLINDSFYQGLLDYPSFTRPDKFHKTKVPAELLSGNHKEIERFRRKAALRLTLCKRPDLLAGFKPEKLDQKLFEEIFLGD